jgi:radical SAM superfamily enzyme YgiQ (UPF0313 family)
VKVLLLMPDAHMHKLRVGGRIRSMREAPLSLTTLAALAPDPDIEWKLVDGSVDPIPRDEAADLVGISVITGNAFRAYELADHYRRRGIPVVLGGVHVTILPGEAAPHADAVVLGLAERQWPRLLGDFKAGRMQRVYREADYPDDFLAGVPPARRDLQRRSGYMMPNTVYATRGCKRTCDFCATPAVVPRYLKRPVADVIRDVRSLKGRYLCFNDVSLIDDVDYARELFTALIPLRKRWGGLTTVEVARHPDLLDLMQRSGCAYLLLGFESVNQNNLQSIYKGFNKVAGYRDVVDALHAHGISVQGCFVLGLDEDDGDVFPATLEQVQEMRLDIPRYSIYTPYPGTLLFKRLQEEGRILTYNWDNYDTMHVVFQPKRMSPEQLYDGFKWTYRETFRLRRIARRVAEPSLNAVINFIGNLAYRIFVRRLYHEPRFAAPYT